MQYIKKSLINKIFYLKNHIPLSEFNKASSGGCPHIFAHSERCEQEKIDIEPQGNRQIGNTKNSLSQ